MRKAKTILIIIVFFLLVTVLDIIMLSIFEDYRHFIANVIGFVEANTVYLSSKTYTTPEKAMKSSNCTCIGKVGEVYCLSDDDYSEYLVVPSRTGWKIIDVYTFIGKYSGIHVQTDTRYYEIRRIGKYWYALIVGIDILSEGESVCIVSRNGIDIKPEFVEWKKPCLYDCFMNLGRKKDDINIAFEDVQLLYNIQQGWQFTLGPYCVGGAVAENGVYSVITGGIVRSGVGSIGGSILWYEAERTDWYYDPIPWKKESSPYDKFIPAERYVKRSKNDVRFFTIEKL